MKTRNWKLCILAIFLAVCFTICAGNCYSQYGNTWSSDYTQYKLGTMNLGLSNILNQYSTGYQLLNPTGFSAFNLYGYGIMGGTNRVPIYKLVYRGETTLDVIQDLMPGHHLTYERLFGKKYEPEEVIVGYEETPGGLSWPGPSWPYPDPYPYPYPYPRPFPDITYGNFSMGFTDYGMSTGLSSQFGTQFGIANPFSRNF